MLGEGGNLSDSFVSALTHPDETHFLKVIKESIFPQEQKDFNMADFRNVRNHLEFVRKRIDTTLNRINESEGKVRDFENDFAKLGAQKIALENNLQQIFAVPPEPSSNDVVVQKKTRKRRTKASLTKNQDDVIRQKCSRLVKRDELPNCFRCCATKADGARCKDRSKACQPASGIQPTQKIFEAYVKIF